MRQWYRCYHSETDVYDVHCCTRWTPLARGTFDLFSFFSLAEIGNSRLFVGRGNRIPQDFTFLQDVSETYLSLHLISSVWIDKNSNSVWRSFSFQDTLKCLMLLAFVKIMNWIGLKNVVVHCLIFLIPRKVLWFRTMMANVRPAGQTLIQAGFLNDPRVDFYKLIIIIYIYKRILIIFRTSLFKKC